ncbi:MAG: MFS transporter, partial [Candidatus Adiutrix sp.]
IFFGFYIKTCLNSTNPILDLRLFSESRRFSFSSLAAFISYSALTGVAFIFSLYLQLIRNLSPSEAGLILMVQPAFQALITPFAGRLSDKIDAGLMASVGMGLLCLGVALLAFNLSPQMNMEFFIMILVLLGIGFAIFSAPNSNAILGSAPPQRVGQAAGVITATRLCGQVFSLALTTFVFSHILGPGEIAAKQPHELMSAFTTCFIIFTPICALGIIASLARGKKNG